MDSQVPRDEPPLMIEQEVIDAELNAALRVAFAQLPAACRQLLSMLMSDPPLSYAEISATLPIPIGSIGPQRARCLDRLRRSPSPPPSVTVKNEKQQSSGRQGQRRRRWAACLTGGTTNNSSQR